MRVLDLFSGIGGFSLGLERAGMETVAFCEIDPFCRKVLKKHWPDVPIFEDIKTLKGDEVGSVDLVCGGFPCQPFSCAGKRRGKEDDRYLWPEMLRVISEAKPTWVIGENVAGIVSMGLKYLPAKVESRAITRNYDYDNYAAILTRQEIMQLDHVCKNLEEKGYEVQPIIIPACAVNAPHQRKRVWILGNSKCNRFNGETIPVQFRGSRQKSNVSAWTDCHAADTRLFGQAQHEQQATGFEQQDCADADTNRQRLQGGQWPPAHGEGQATHGSTTKCNSTWEEPWPEVAARLCRVDARVPGRVDRLRALGNAVVPQIPEIIGRCIMEIESVKMPQK